MICRFERQGDLVPIRFSAAKQAHTFYRLDEVERLIEAHEHKGDR